MSTQTYGLRGYRRRKTLLDLNVPPSESREREHDGSSTLAVSQAVEGTPHSVTPTTIDVEAFDDDDVIESSPRAFAVAKDNAHRARVRNVVVDVDTGRTSRLTCNNHNNKRRRVQSNQTIINCDLYVNLESSSSSTRHNAQPLQIPLPPPPPSKEPTFNCPICMGPLVEETSTRCGHIFCKTCIKTAIAAQAKCPTCRKRVTVKELIRVFLPATG